MTESGISQPREDGVKLSSYYVCTNGCTWNVDLAYRCSLYGVYGHGVDYASVLYDQVD
jgi:hypothetical protein